MLTYPLGFFAADILAGAANFIALENVKYTGTSYASGLGNPQGIRFFSTNKFFVCDANADAIREYTYTPGDISTASQTFNFSIAGQETTAVGFDMKPDGSKMYVLGVDSDQIHEYTLSTPGDLSTASFTQSSASIGLNATDLYISRNGDYVYYPNGTNDVIERRPLSTAWDVSTMGAVDEEIEVGQQEFNPDAIWINEAAGQLFVMGRNSGSVNDDGGDIFGYNLPDQLGGIENGSYSGHYSDFSRLNAEVRALCFTDDYTKGYFAGIGANVGVIYELDLPPVSNFGLVNAYDALGLEFEGLADFSGTIANNSMFSAIMSPDGTKGLALYRKNPDELREFDCSTPYDWSTATLNGNLVTLSSIGAPNFSNNAIDLFSIDGNILYVTVPSSGAATQGVYQYNFNTPYDVTDTITYIGFSGSIGNVPFSAMYNPTGTKLYIGNGAGANTVQQWSLNTANDISGGIVFEGTYANADIGPIRNVRFNNDGTIAYLGTSDAIIHQVKLDTAYDFTGTVTYQNQRVIDGLNGLYQFEMYDNGEKAYACSAAPYVRQFTPKFVDPFEAVLGSATQISNTYSPISTFTDYSIAADFGRAITYVQAEFVCLIANNGYSVGDVVQWHHPYFNDNAGAIQRMGIVPYSTESSYGCVIGANYTRISAKTGGGNVNVIGTANWGLRIKAYTKIPTIHSQSFTYVDDSKATLVHNQGAGNYFPYMEHYAVNGEDNWPNRSKIYNMSKAYNPGNGSSVIRGTQCGYNGTEAWVLNGSAIQILNKTSPSTTATLTPGNWRTKLKMLKLPTPDFTTYVAGPLADGASFSSAHGLSNPVFCQTEWENVTAEDNWAIGDICPVNWTGWDTAGVGNDQMRGFTGGYDASNCFYACSINSNMNLDKNTPTQTAGNIMTGANWRLRFSAWNL